MDRTRLLSDNGPGYVSKSFRDYLGMVDIKHISATPSRPQTSKMLDRCHPTLKLVVNGVPYELPDGIKAAIAAVAAVVRYYHRRRYHKRPGDLTASAAPKGRWEVVLQHGKEV